MMSSMFLAIFQLFCNREMFSKLSLPKFLVVVREQESHEYTSIFRLLTGI